MKPSRWLFAFVLLIGVGLSINASAADKIGVVVLHGKWGSPDGHTSGLANFLAGEGFLVASPEMPWSGRRTYDKGADAFVTEIDAAAAELRAKGAKKSPSSVIARVRRPHSITRPNVRWTASP